MAKQPVAFQLVSTNLTQLGGRMGTERTFENFVRYFSTADIAKAAAQADYGRTEIRWRRAKEGFTSGDLGYVMYEVQPLYVED